LFFSSANSLYLAVKETARHAL